MWGQEANICRVFDERKPLEPTYPSISPSIADFVVEEDERNSGVTNGAKSVNGDGGYTSEEALRFAPPG